MLNVRLAGGHVYGKQLFTWLSLVVFWWRLFVLSLFPLDVWDAIWDVTESVSEGFLTYFYSTFKNIALITSWSLSKGGLNPDLPEKNSPGLP